MMQKPNMMDYPRTTDGYLQYQTDLDVWMSQQREKLMRSDEQNSRDQFAPPPDTIQVSRAEYEALRRDAERLDALESNLWFVEPQYQYDSPKYKVGKADNGAIAGTLRAAIDAAINMSANGEGE
jgi:hypothetical protein